MHPHTTEKIIQNLIRANSAGSVSPFYTEVFDEAEDRWISIASVVSYKTNQKAWKIRYVDTGERLIETTDYAQILATLRLDSSNEEYGTW